METIDKIHKWLMKNKPEYKNLGFDQQGQLCVKLEDLLINCFGGKVDKS